MGGYGSGRRKTHHITNDCLSIDTVQLRKHKLLTGNKLRAGIQVKYTSQMKTVKEKTTERQHYLSIIVECYGPDGVGEFTRWGAVGQMTLMYGVRIGEEDKGKQCVDIPLVVTHPNYGGTRYWLLAPCCGRRVRVVYLPTYGAMEHILPQCRDCLGLHYASQQQSYIERHKTYERHLLANYGWAWAEMDYHSLREHYLEITPEIEYLRQQSILQMRMRMLRLLLSSTRLILRMDMRNLRSLRSEEDRQLYMEHIRKERGETYGLELVHMFELGFKMERQARYSSSEVFDHAYNEVEKLLAQRLESDTWLADPDIGLAIAEASKDSGKMNLHYLLAYKEQLEEDIEELEKLKPAA